MSSTEDEYSKPKLKAQDVLLDAEKGSENQAEHDAEGNDSRYILTFDGPDDQTNPVNWSPRYKWSIIALLSTMTLVVNLATLMCAPAAPVILKQFSSNNQLYANLLVSIWELGEAFGPLIVAPLSEILGREPIYHTANILFVVFSVAGAVSTDLDMLIVFRFFNGIAVASVTLNPSIVGDMFVLEERGSAMAIMNLAPVLGPIAGPIIGGYISETIGWRWTFWLAAIVAGVIEMGFVAIYRETYKVRILQQRVTQLRRKTGNASWKSFPTGTTTRKRFWRDAIIRPVRMLILSPILFILAMYNALVFGYLYLFLTSITETFQTTYNFSTGSASLTFLGLGLGMTTGMFLCRATLDRYIKKKKAAGCARPEHRLPPMVFGTWVIPVGIFLFGWTTHFHVHWIVPVVGTSLLGFGVAVTIIPTFSYIVDAFGIHAASALAISISLRCLMGAFIPLAGPPLYENLGVGWGNSVLGFIALVFTPVPLVLMKYGEQIRRSSKFQIVF